MNTYACRIIDDTTIELRTGTRGSLTFSVGGPVAGLTVQGLCNTINDLQAELQFYRATFPRAAESWKRTMEKEGDSHV